MNTPEHHQASRPAHQSISVVIPTYQREQVLLDTIRVLLRQTVQVKEIIIVDQTPQHEPETDSMLGHWQREKQITWVHLSRPSLAEAMNFGLQSASSEIVLFLDDDIQVRTDFLQAHLAAFGMYPESSAVVGQVLQPGQTPLDTSIACERSGFYADIMFPFWSTRGAWVSNVMGGNLSVRKGAAVIAGGFDENFSGVAFRIETDFARRLIKAGGKIRFHPDASIDHLRHPSGGTRSSADNEACYSTKQAMGDYYFVFLHARGCERWRYIYERLHRELRTSYYFRHPWLIPGKCLSELKAFFLAWKMAGERQKKPLHQT